MLCLSFSLPSSTLFKVNPEKTAEKPSKEWRIHPRHSTGKGYGSLLLKTLDAIGGSWSPFLGFVALLPILCSESLGAFF